MKKLLIVFVLPLLLLGCSKDPLEEIMNEELSLRNQLIVSVGEYLKTESKASEIESKRLKKLLDSTIDEKEELHIDLTYEYSEQ